MVKAQRTFFKVKVNSWSLWLGSSQCSRR